MMIPEDEQQKRNLRIGLFLISAFALMTLGSVLFVAFGHH
jgi:hypothetical protein